MRDEMTTVQLKKTVVKELKNKKRYPRETYNEVILSLIKAADSMTEYDELLHKAQQAKMKELWDEGDYKKWESA